MLTLIKHVFDIHTNNKIKEQDYHHRVRLRLRDYLWIPLVTAVMLSSILRHQSACVVVGSYVEEK